MATLSMCTSGMVATAPGLGFNFVSRPERGLTVWRSQAAEGAGTSEPVGERGLSRAARVQRCLGPQTGRAAAALPEELPPCQLGGGGAPTCCRLPQVLWSMKHQLHLLISWGKGSKSNTSCLGPVLSCSNVWSLALLVVAGSMGVAGNSLALYVLLWVPFGLPALGP